MQDVGRGKCLKEFSDSEVKMSQLVFLKLLGSANQPSRSTKIGKWSELRVVMGTQLALTPRWELVMVISGEDVGPLDGTLVELFRFITTYVVLSSAPTMSTPWVAVAPLSVEEYNRASWALKSPIIWTSSVV